MLKNVAIAQLNHKKVHVGQVHLNCKNAVICLKIKEWKPCKTKAHSKNCPSRVITMVCLHAEFWIDIMLGIFKSYYIIKFNAKKNYNVAILMVTGDDEKISFLIFVS